jgi:hypothetical protein
MNHRLCSIPTVLAILCLLLASAARAAAAADDAKPDDEGFIRDWLLLAPFPLGEENAGADHIDKTQITNEASLKPKPGDKQKIGDAENAWRPIKAKDYYFDLNEILTAQHENVLAYLVTYVVADKDMPDLTLLIGSNDQAKIYVNGKEVLKFTETRTVEKDSDKAEKVALKKGTNVIVFKLINETNNWQGCLRFKDKDDKPVKDLTIKTTP